MKIKFTRGSQQALFMKTDKINEDRLEIPVKKLIF